MTYSSKTFVDVITVEDKSDPYVSEMLSIGGFTVKNSMGGLVRPFRYGNVFSFLLRANI